MIRERLLTATLTNLSVKVVTLAIRFFLTPFILHRLGATQFGLLALVGSVAGQVEFLDFGIRSALTKYVAEHYSQADFGSARQYIATSFLLYSCLAALAILLVAAISPFFSHFFNVPRTYEATARIVFLLSGIQIAVSLPGTAPAAVLWGLHRYGLANLLFLISTVVSAIITVGVLLLGGEVTATVAANTPLPFVMLLVGIYAVRRVAPELKWGWRDVRRDLFKSVLSFSGATFIIDIGYGLQTRCDEIIIGAFSLIQSVGPYSIARRLSGLPQILTQSTIGALLPLASELQAQGDLDQIASLYLTTSRVALAISIPLCCVLIGLAGPLLALWVGQEYSQYAPVVVILTLASLAEISHWPGGQIMQGIGRHYHLAAGYVCAGLVNIVLSILLIRPYGLIGVALGTLIPSTVLSLCFVWPYVSLVLGIRWHDLLRRILLPVIFPIAPMAGVIHFCGLVQVPPGLIFIFTGVTAATGLLTYAAVYLVFGADDRERHMIRSLMNNLAVAISARSRIR